MSSEYKVHIQDVHLGNGAAELTHDMDKLTQSTLDADKARQIHIEGMREYRRIVSQAGLPELAELMPMLFNPVALGVTGGLLVYKELAEAQRKDIENRKEQIKLAREYREEVDAASRKTLEDATTRTMEHALALEQQATAIDRSSVAMTQYIGLLATVKKGTEDLATATNKVTDAVIAYKIATGEISAAQGSAEAIAAARQARAEKEAAEDQAAEGTIAAKADRSVTARGEATLFSAKADEMRKELTDVEAALNHQQQVVAEAKKRLAANEGDKAQEVLAASQANAHRTKADLDQWVGFGDSMHHNGMWQSEYNRRKQDADAEQANYARNKKMMDDSVQAVADAEAHAAELENQRKKLVSEIGSADSKARERASKAEQLDEDVQESKANLAEKKAARAKVDAAEDQAQDIKAKTDKLKNWEDAIAAFASGRATPEQFRLLTDSNANPFPSAGKHAGDLNGLAGEAERLLNDPYHHKEGEAADIFSRLIRLTEGLMNAHKPVPQAIVALESRLADLERSYHNTRIAGLADRAK